jgi:hypothetical protein
MLLENRIYSTYDIIWHLKIDHCKKITFIWNEHWYNDQVKWKNVLRAVGNHQLLNYVKESIMTKEPLRKGLDCDPVQLDLDLDLWEI